MRYALLLAAGCAAAPFTILPLGDSITYGCGNVDTCGVTHDPRSKTCGYERNDSKLPARKGCQSDKVVGCPYTPCPTCMGDAGSGSYRAPLKALLEGWQPQTFEFVGTRHGGGTAHMGFPGWRIDQIYNISANWTALAPDAITLLIGTNDVMQGPYAYAPFPTSQFPQMKCDGFGNSSAPFPWHCDVSTLAGRMDVLLAKIFEQLPHTQLFLSTITGLPTVNLCYYWPNGETDQRSLGLAYNAYLPALVEKYSARGFAVTLVDMLNQTGVGREGQDACPCHIHPDDDGYAKMATAWFDSLRAHLRLPEDGLELVEQ